jgi:zona occludens toxin
MSLLTDEYSDRVLYVDGVPDLKLDHQSFDPLTWPDDLPDGAVAVIDEVQRVWRPRGPGQKVPPSVSALETHRHRGLDFVLVTQAPRLLDTNVRALVGRHVHLRDTGILGRWWYEWPEVSESLAWRTATIKKRYRLPKKVFGLYRSASMHIKPVRSVPPMLIVLVVAVVAALWFAYRSVSSLRGHMSGPAPASAPASGVLPGGARPGRTGEVVADGSRSLGHLRDAAAYRAVFRPADPNEPLTAPAYDALRRVVRMPRIVGGYCTPDGCRCFDQDGNRPAISDAACRDRVMYPRFDPYVVPDHGESSRVASSGGQSSSSGDGGSRRAPASAAGSAPGAAEAME